MNSLNEEQTLRLVLLGFTKVGFKGSAICRFHLDVSHPSSIHHTEQNREGEGMDFESLRILKGTAWDSMNDFCSKKATAVPWTDVHLSPIFQAVRCLCLPFQALLNQGWCLAKITCIWNYLFTYRSSSSVGCQLLKDGAVLFIVPCFCVPCGT